MNAITPIISKQEQEARELAAEILAGKYPKGPWGDDGVYTAREWIAAAEYLTDTDDWSEVSYMMGQEVAGPDYETDRWADEADHRYDLMREREWEERA